MPASVVITGIGMVTPPGREPGEVLRRIQAGESAAAPPVGFDAGPFACPLCAQVRDFDAQPYAAETKMLRLMNRDAQLAVAAAHLALRDARLEVAKDYAPEEIALFGATGLAGLPLDAVAPLIKASVEPDGQFSLTRFGRAGLRAISPLLSFKILGNMPVCFISICERLQGPNAVYTPWEGHGAQAIAAGVRALEHGYARCAVVGGCDVKTHELAFISLEQQGLFRSWREQGAGVVPGEGAVFLVLERDDEATRRGARRYARVGGLARGACHQHQDRAVVYAEVLKRLGPQALHPRAIIQAADGDGRRDGEEAAALAALSLKSDTVLSPKRQVGNLFAAAAALQVAVGALVTERGAGPVVANCFGQGSEQAAFLLEAP